MMARMLDIKEGDIGRVDVRGATIVGWRFRLEQR